MTPCQSTPPSPSRTGIALPSIHRSPLRGWRTRNAVRHGDILSAEARRVDLSCSASSDGNIVVMKLASLRSESGGTPKISSIAGLA